MPRSLDAERELAAAREALAAEALDRARDAAWRAAASAAQIGDAAALEEVVEIVSALAASKVDGVEQLQTYAKACLEDARAGTRPPSMFERLMSRGRRSR
jgi:phage shock protein A